MNSRIILLAITALGDLLCPAQQMAPPPAQEAPPTQEAPPDTVKESVTLGTASPTTPQPSLTVQVEKIQTGKGVIDPKTVKLLAPFPAKQLASCPPGWHLEPATKAPPFIRNVDLEPGASIPLNIRPHLLVPDADGAATFSINEPGFNATLGYSQSQTVSAILATAIQQLDEDSKQLGNAIDQLQQLVSSLPQPAPKPQAPAPAINNKPPNKR